MVGQDRTSEHLGSEFVILGVKIRVFRYKGPENLSFYALMEFVQVGFLIKENALVNFGTYKMFVVMENSYKWGSTVRVKITDSLSHQWWISLIGK